MRTAWEKIRTPHFLGPHDGSPEGLNTEHAEGQLYITKLIGTALHEFKDLKSYNLLYIPIGEKNLENEIKWSVIRPYFMHK